MLFWIPATITHPAQPEGQARAEAWAQAIKAAQWQEVYRLGERFLTGPASAEGKSPDWDRMLGFTWYAAFQETKAGRSKRDPLACLLNAKRLLPDQDEVWFALGTEQHRVGKDPEAKLSLQEYLKRVPDSFDGGFAMAQVLIELQAFAEAQAHLLALAKRAPDSDRVLAELAFVQNERKDFEGAVSTLQQALKIEPKRATIHLELAFAFRQLKRWDEAALALDRAASLGISANVIQNERKLLAAERNH